MLTVFARPFIYLGEEIQGIRGMFVIVDSEANEPGRALTAEETEGIRDHLRQVLEHCEKLDLPICKKLVSARLMDPPKTGREFEILTDALYAEIADKVFVFVPSHRRKFMRPKEFMQEEQIKNSFPNAWVEMAEAGRCHAVGAHTAAATAIARKPICVSGVISAAARRWNRVGLIGLFLAFAFSALTSVVGYYI
jgi:hypothetical protein